jgi:uracil-DNA glycosylase
MLRGAFAKSKSKFIDSSKHLLLTSSHPSPLAANQGGWFGNNHFKLCNEYLEKQGKKAINWSRL